MMVTSIKQHISNIWSSTHEKIKQHLDWVEKKCCLYKKSVYHAEQPGMTDEQALFSTFLCG